MTEPSNYENVPCFYQAKRDRFATGMAKSRFKLLPCEGSYFQTADYSAISPEDDMSFAQRVARERPDLAALTDEAAGYYAELRYARGDGRDHKLRCLQQCVRRLPPRRRKRS